MLQPLAAGGLMLLAIRLTNLAQLALSRGVLVEAQAGACEVGGYAAVWAGPVGVVRAEQQALDAEHLACPVEVALGIQPAGGGVSPWLAA